MLNNVGPLGLMLLVVASSNPIGQTLFLAGAAAYFLNFGG